MVKGLDLFKAHFAQFTDHYILIGGGACDVQFTQKELDFRVTKDLDIILLVEALTNEFVQVFWDFIKAGEYAIAEIDSKKCFYRFIQPAAQGYPKMLELFARKPDVISVIPDFHITDIPTGEEVSSLSAILMDDIYYGFTIANSEIIDGLHVANGAALICLKARAFLNNRQRKTEGQIVQEVDIVKHKNDIIKLVSTLDPNKKVTVPAIIATDLYQYIQIILEENINIKVLLKPMGLGNLQLAEIVERIQLVFGLESLISVVND